MKTFFKKIKFLSVLFFMASYGYAQPTYKHWDFRFGGSKDDAPSWMEQTVDGGFLIGGTSVSGISGDKTQPNWDPGLIGSDFWVLRLDSLGTKMWDKRFGGINSEILVDLLTTSDGGFLLAGNSFSGASGDKSQPNWDVTQQSYDYWILKANANGIKQWDKRFGGNSLELLGGVVQTSDKGYILAGASFSGISGDKTQSTQGSWDYWVVRIDSLGNKIWDKRYGGTDDDFATSIVINQNGGILIGGYSQSLAGGDKSQFCQGQWDYWVVRIDLNGNLLWERTFGGNYTDWLFDMTATSDGGYILAGQSFSENTGDKSEPNHDPTPSSSDRWIVKIDDSGNKIWDRTIGGTETEDLSRIDESIDGGFILSGESYSPISGNKTESNLGVEQTWVVKTDSAGFPIWDKTIFSTGHDEEGTALELSNGCLVTLNYTLADTGGYKSQLTRGDGDYWLVKLCEFPSTTSINEGISNKLETLIYPNPTKEKLNIKLSSNFSPSSLIDYKITDMRGIIVRIGKINPNDRESISIEINGFKTGLYLLYMNDSENAVIQKFTIID
ncbi:MAG: hypothetical protein RL491_272 [Bacteroidota bacterium]